MSIEERYSHYEHLVLDLPQPRVLRITLSNPGKANSIPQPMHAELAEIWRDVTDDPNLSAVILTGAGAAFSAGGDFSMAQAISEDFDERVRGWKETKDLVYNLLNCSKPVISAVRGPAVGAGLVCALLADISIVAKDAVLIDGHTRLGVTAGDHGVMLWPLLCGMAKAKYYLLTCDRLSGEEAERIGLVSLAVDDAELDAKAQDIAMQLASGAQTSIRWTKYSLNNWWRQAGPIFDTSVALEMLSFSGPEVKEGLAAHLEKRPPAFPTECIL